MAVRFRTCLFSVAIIILSSYCTILVTPVDADASENYPFSGSLTNPYTLSGSSAVAYSNDGSIIAASFYQSVVIIDSNHRTFIKEIDVGNKVLDVTFSDDDLILLVGLESPYMSTLAMALYETTDWVRIGVNEDGKEVTDISVLPNAEIFASPNEQFGVNEYTYEDSSNNIFTYDGIHTDYVTCVDHTPDGNYLITGSKDGSVVVWDRSNQEVAQHQGNDLIWPTEFEITDCSISPDGSKFAWAANTLLQVRSIPEGSYLTSKVLSGYAEQLEWSLSSDELWIQTQSSSPNILVLDTTNYDVINNFDIGHRVSEFALSPLQDEFIVSSNSPHISFFRMDMWAPYAGMVGLDTDGDGTPNDFDSDDDGDGVGDDFEYVCSEGNDCHLHPDPSLVRQISISLTDNKITILDKLELNSTQSAPLRDLAAATVTSDGLVDEGEALKIQRMLCSGTDENSILEDWREGFNLNNSVYVSGTVRCDTKSGLSGTEKHESKTRIQLRWFIEIILSNQVHRPFTFTFDPSIPAPEHTVSQIVPNSPFSLTVIHEGNHVHYEFPINPQESLISINVEVLPEPNPTTVDLAISWLVENYLIPLATFVIISITTLVVVRRRNRILFDYDDDEEIIISKRSSTKRRQPKGPPIKDSGKSRPQPISRPKGAEKSQDDQYSKGRPQPIKPSNVAKKRRVKRETVPKERSVKKVKGTRRVAPNIQTNDYPDEEEIQSDDEGDEFGLENMMMKEIAKQVSSDKQVEQLESEEDEAIIEDEMMAALSLITDTEIADDGKKKRRKVKRRKK